MEKNKELTYGELSMSSFPKFTELVKSYKSKSFLDIGSGYGAITRYIFENLNIPSTGIEIMLCKHEIAKKINISQNKRDLKYINGDIIQNLSLIKKHDFIYLNNLLLNKSTIDLILNETTKKNIILLTSIRKINMDKFNLLNQFKLNYSYGSGFNTYIINKK